MKNNIDEKITKGILELLREQTEKEEEPKNQKKKASSPAGMISTTGAFGTGGRPSKFATSAKARATDDPKGLMQDLGITKPASGGDLESALQILNLAIYGNAAMSEAYNGAKITTDSVVTDKKQRGMQVISIAIGKIDSKNGIRFLAHTLTAAQNSGFLSLRGGLQFARGLNNPVIIYSF